MRFYQKAPKRTFLTRREADVLLGMMERRASDAGEDVPENATGDASAGRGRREVIRALAARDHAAFSMMIYAGLRIEETTALTIDDLSFARGSEEVRVAKGKGKQGAARADGTEAQALPAPLPEGQGRARPRRGEFPSPTSSSPRKVDASPRAP